MYRHSSRNTSGRKHKSRRRRKRRDPALVLSTLLMLVFSVFLLMAVVSLIRQKEETGNEAEQQTWEQEEITETEAQYEEEGETEEAFPETPAAWEVPELGETDIYTFSQGPYAWNNKMDWGGSWCAETLNGQYFSVFGCGLCDLANIYSTLTSCDCSPLDMYYYAQEASGYAPGYDAGAIDWPYLQQTLATCGIVSELREKDQDYEAFRQTIAGSVTAICLIGSAADDTYWQGVDGHYVNIWLYDESDDTVFLADSGDPAHNRQRIPLRYVYDAMLTYSSYQYLLVTYVDENANTWQHDGITSAWNPPAYYKGQGNDL